MLFDRLCGFVERGFLPADLEPMVRAAALIHFPCAAHELLDPTLGLEQEDTMADEFFLPLPVVAVEDRASVIVLQNVPPYSIGEAPTTGMHQPFRYIECMTTRPEPEAFGPGQVSPSPIPGHQSPTGEYAVTWGEMRDLKHIGSQFSCNLRVQGAVFATKREVLHRISPPNSLIPLLQKQSADNVKAAIRELMVFNSPDRWVLEESSTKPQKRRKPKKGRGEHILRSDERPRYTLMTAHEIREKLHLQDHDAGGPGVRPHERRAYWRTYRHERFASSGLQGKKVLIPSTWVGPSEHVDKQRRYRVRLDL